MSIESDIFMKCSEKSPEQNINPTSEKSLSKKNIFDNIPQNAQKIENPELRQTKTEWRWRIFSFPHKKNEVIEISFQKPNNERLYIDKNGNWIPYNLDNIYDQFVTDIFYYYDDK